MLRDRCLQQPEVVRPVLLGDSPCCGVPCGAACCEAKAMKPAGSRMLADASGARKMSGDQRQDVSDNKGKEDSGAKRAATFPVNAVVRETIMERQVHFLSRATENGLCAVFRVHTARDKAPALLLGRAKSEDRPPSRASPDHQAPGHPPHHPAAPPAKWGQRGEVRRRGERGEVRRSEEKRDERR